MTNMGVLKACALLMMLALASGAPFVDPAHDNSHLIKCNASADCGAGRECAVDANFKVDGDDQQVCLHKELFSGFSLRDGLTGFTVFVCTLMASSAGIGGGGLFTPVYIMLGGFIIQEATPLSHATVMGNALAQLLINFPKRHPYVEGKGKPLIDYAAPLLLLPPQLAGNALGVLLNPMFPPNALIIVAELLLVFAIYKVFTKARMYYKEECQQENAAKDEKVKIVADEAQGYSTDAVTKYSEEAHMMLEAESKVPKHYVLMMVVFWVLFACCFVGMKVAGTCSNIYWVLFSVLYPVVIAFVYAGVRMMKKHNEHRENLKLPAVRGSLSLDSKTLLVAPTLACGVGLVAGLLGLGGGELMAPLLLELGMVPKVASATSAYMIVWTTSSDIVHYITTADLNLAYTLFFACISFVGALFGRHYGLVFAQKYNRQSAIAFTLGVLLVISMVLFAVRAAETKVADPWWPFKNPCPSS